MHLLTTHLLTTHSSASILSLYVRCSNLASPRMFDASAKVDSVSDDAGPPPPQRPAGADLRRFIGWTFIGIGIGLVVVLIALRQANYDPTPTLTPKLFEAAHERWKLAAAPNYDIEIRVTGPQAAVYRCEVRDGEPQAAWRNGQPLTSRRTFGTWSVPGM